MIAYVVQRTNRNANRHPSELAKAASPPRFALGGTPVRAKGGGVVRLLFGDAGFAARPAPFVDAVNPSHILELADPDDPDADPDGAAAAFIGMVGLVLGGMAISIPCFSRSIPLLVRR
jgi:hypothetical protein